MWYYFYYSCIVGIFISVRQKSAWWKWFVPQLYQLLRGILEGPALKYFYMIHRGGRMYLVIFFSFFALWKVALRLVALRPMIYGSMIRRALWLVALLRKITCNLRHPMGLGHPEMDVSCDAFLPVSSDPFFIWCAHTELRHGTRTRMRRPPTLIWGGYGQ